MGIIALIKDGGKGIFTNFTLSYQIKLPYLQPALRRRKKLRLHYENSKLYEIH